MKSILALSFVLLFCVVTIAQTTSISAGFLLAPQAGMVLKNPGDGLKSSIPIFIQMSVKKDILNITPFYGLTGNAIGGSVEINILSLTGVYLVANKCILNKDTYTGIGITRNIDDDKAQMFVEVGVPNKQPLKIFIGVFIPLMQKITQ